MDRTQLQAVWVFCTMMICGAGRPSHAAEPLSAPDSSVASAAASPATQPADARELQDSDQVAEQAKPWWDMERLLAPYDKAKDFLAAKGLMFNLTYTDIWQNSARGGQDTNDATRHTGVYNVILQLDTEKAGLWKGGLLSVLMEGTVGRSLSDQKIGDLLGVNGVIRTEHDFQVSVVSYEQRLLEDRILLKFGKLDPSADFDNNNYANNANTQFLNNGLCNSSTIPFPDYSLGVETTVSPASWGYGRIGLFDAEGRGGRTGFDTAFHGPAYFFLMNEYGLTPTLRIGKKVYGGAYRAGYWYDPTPKEYFLQAEDAETPRMSSGDWGAYLSFDQLVWKENNKEGDQQGLGLFFRYGYADGSVNTIANAWSYGLQYAGLIPSRDDDVIGFGVAHASLSETLGHVEPGMERETVMETYYNFRVNKYIQISPDMQVIVDPGGNDDLRNAIVAGIRLTACF